MRVTRCIYITKGGSEIKILSNIDNFLISDILPNEGEVEFVDLVNVNGAF